MQSLRQIRRTKSPTNRRLCSAGPLFGAIPTSIVREAVAQARLARCAHSVQQVSIATRKADSVLSGKLVNL